MLQSSYEEESWDAASAARAREQHLLSRAIELLQQVKSGEQTRADCINAMLYVRKLWTFFIEDLSRPDNGLPPELRANLISIGIWIIKEADLIRNGDPGDLASLIDVHTTMRDALR
jgi:flagellar protein FlaF